MTQQQNIFGSIQIKPMLTSVLIGLYCFGSSTTGHAIERLKVCVGRVDKVTRYPATITSFLGSEVDNNLYEPKTRYGVIEWRHKGKTTLSFAPSCYPNSNFPNRFCYGVDTSTAVWVIYPRLPSGSC